MAAGSVAPGSLLVGGLLTPPLTGTPPSFVPAAGVVGVELTGAVGLLGVTLGVDTGFAMPGAPEVELGAPLSPESPEPPESPQAN